MTCRPQTARVYTILGQKYFCASVFGGL